MNAGAYGADIASVLDWAEIVTRDGNMVRLATPPCALATAAPACPKGPWWCVRACAACLPARRT